MQHIVTLTMNPTIDKTTSVEQVEKEVKLRCGQAKREPGGGGINVSRAIQKLGGASRCVYTAGGPVGRILQDLLGDEDLEHHPVEVRNETRENFVVFEQSSRKQYRFGLPGPDLSDGEWRGCLDVIENLDPFPDILVGSGSLPPGVPDDFYGRMAEIGSRRNCKVAVDSSGAALRGAFQAGVYLLKPNMKEFSEITGKYELEDREIEEEARSLIQAGRAAVIAVSLGAGGALIVDAEQTLHISSPTVPIRSKIGAGDSMTAGMLLGIARGMDFPEWTRFGVAAGAAAVMTEGTELCRREDTERLYREMQS
jgi:6-phosphofructokinase 2